MQLSDIQENFKTVILDPAQMDGPFRAMFRQDAGISLENRMKIYRNNVIRNLTDAALAALPMTKKLVGEKFLEQAVRAYVVDNLPAEGNISLYGITFPEFIRNYEPTRNLPWLYDMTRLEWAREYAYYAADDKAVDLAELSGIPHADLPHLRFFFRASVALIESDYPLDAMIDFCSAPEPHDPLDISQRDAKILVFRPALAVEIRKLDDSEYAFLIALRAGKSIAEAAESAPGLDLAAILQKYLGLGIFAGFDYDRAAPGDTP